MTIEKIERRSAHVAGLKLKYKYEQIIANLNGSPLDAERADQIINNIELSKLLNSFDLIELKWDRWCGFSEVGEIDGAAPSAVHRLQGEMLRLRQKLDGFIAQL